MALFLFFSKQIQVKQVWTISTMLALIMVFVFYTQTRSSWLSVMTQLILLTGFFLIKRRAGKDWINWNSAKTKASWLAFGLFLLLINFNDQSWSPFWGRVAAKLVAIGTNATEGNARFEIWKVALEMVKTGPIFGTGLGSWFHNEIQGGFGTHNVMTF